MKRIFHHYLLLLFTVVIVSGCSLFDTEHFVDSHLDEKGNTVLEDTPGNWQFYQFSVDLRVSNEVQGKVPEAGVQSWNEYWLLRVQDIPSNRENREKYVNYIIERRRQEGLPELRGYPD